MQPLTCSRCGAAIVPGTRFCAGCGASAPEAPAFCAQCGGQTTPGARFCGTCGQPVAAAPAPPPVASIVPSPPPAWPSGPPGQPLPVAPQPAAPARGGKPWLWVGLALASVAVAVFVAGPALMEFLAGFREVRAGPSRAPQAAPTATVPVPAPAAPAPEALTAGGVTLIKPAGWASQPQGDQGFVVAARQEDLTADTVRGARLRLQVIAGTRPGMEAVVQSVLPAGTSPAAVAGAVGVVEEPRSVQVGGLEGTAMSLRQESGGRTVTTRHVIVNAGGGRVYLFLLEAPADQWGQDLPSLEGILQSATFAPGVATQAPPVVRQQRFDSPPPASPDPSRITLALVGTEWDVAFVSPSAYSHSLDVADWSDRYELTVAGRIVDGPPRTALGVRLRLASDPARHHVTIVVEDGGTYLVTAETGSGDTSIIRRTPQTLLRPRGELNTVVVRVNRPRVDVALNGLPLTTFDLPGATARAGIFGQAPEPARVRFAREQASPLP